MRVLQRCNTHTTRIIRSFYEHREGTMRCSLKPFAAQELECATRGFNVAPLASHAEPCLTNRGAAHGGDAHKCADRPGPVDARSGAERTRVRVQRAAIPEARRRHRQCRAKASHGWPGQEAVACRRVRAVPDDDGAAFDHTGRGSGVPGSQSRQTREFAARSHMVCLLFAFFFMHAMKL